MEFDANSIRHKKDRIKIKINVPDIIKKHQVNKSEDIRSKDLRIKTEKGKIRSVKFNLIACQLQSIDQNQEFV